MNDGSALKNFKYGGANFRERNIPNSDILISNTRKCSDGDTGASTCQKQSRGPRSSPNYFTSLWLRAETHWRTVTYFKIITLTLLIKNTQHGFNTRNYNSSSSLYVHFWTQTSAFNKMAWAMVLALAQYGLRYTHRWILNYFPSWCSCSYEHRRYISNVIFHMILEKVRGVSWTAGVWIHDPLL